MTYGKRSSLLSILTCLTLLSISAQLSLFIIHTHATELVDTLISSSIAGNIIHHAILLPFIAFISVQACAYLLLIGFIWFITVSCSEFFKVSNYGLGIFFWLIAHVAIFILNTLYFPGSFFAMRMPLPHSEWLLGFSGSILILATILAYYQLFRQKRHVLLGLVFLSLMSVTLIAKAVNYFSTQALHQPLAKNGKPNIILIGLDSLRPDYLHYFGKHAIHTPYIDQFLKTAVAFTDAYTPLARTFPAWVSILTGKYPKHSHARINLSDAEPIAANDTLAKQLQRIDYETFYATDEKRFSNITTAYGFDHVIGPSMGLNDFILGNLSDFPLTNLMINLPLGRFLFPYNYGNRAAAITYQPDNFLQLLKAGLNQRHGKPILLALHFCVTHWPFTWANDHQSTHLTSNERYQSSIEKVDQQLGELLQILKENGLLEHAWVVLLSDHGTTLGLPGDRIIDKQHYQGDPAKLAWITVNKLSTGADHIDLQQNYSLNTSYGQGTDILSLKQYRVLLAFKYFAPPTHKSLVTPHATQQRSALLDIAPTILGLLHLPPMQKTDGQSLEPAIFKSTQGPPSTRPLYLETGYSISEIETDHIKVEKVVGRALHLYHINPDNGYLYIKPAAESDILKSKQRAILLGNWLLARYPVSERARFVKQANTLSLTTYHLPAYYVLANLKTGQWSIGLDTAFSKTAPVAELQKQFKAFYGDELSEN